MNTSLATSPALEVWKIEISCTVLFCSFLTNEQMPASNLNTILLTAIELIVIQTYVFHECN